MHSGKRQKEQMCIVPVAETAGGRWGVGGWGSVNDFWTSPDPARGLWGGGDVIRKVAAFVDWSGMFYVHFLSHCGGGSMQVMCLHVFIPELSTDSGSNV